MRTLLPALIFLLPLGCLGPLPERLNPKMQSAVDQTWQNVFPTPNHLDRAMLLDVMVLSNLHQYGVDRFDLKSEKEIPNGVVRMEVHFERLNPAADRYTICYMDPNRRPLRTEHYSREEVDQRMKYLFGQQSTEYDPAKLKDCGKLATEKERHVCEVQKIIQPMLAEQKAEQTQKKQQNQTGGQ